LNGRIFGAHRDGEGQLTRREQSSRGWEAESKAKAVGAPALSSVYW